jgi:undecaprenyl diphosphate synthase
MLEKDICKQTLPNHIAIIMDGNRRWAKNHHLPRIEGHRRGTESIKRTIEFCIKNGIHYLTLYSFSTDNWRRPLEEVAELMGLLRFYLRHEVQNMHKNNIKINIIGDLSALPEDLQDELISCQQLTANNNALVLTLAISYGGRQEIVQAIRKMVTDCIEADNINEELVSSYLYTHDIPDPDLVIRTSNEYRISNFLLWQISYAELFFTNIMWPDFGEQELTQAILAYQQRERRYGAS